MWLLLVAAGTGYLAGYWQSALNNKSLCPCCRKVSGYGSTVSPLRISKESSNSVSKGDCSRKKKSPAKILCRMNGYATMEEDLRFSQTNDEMLGKDCPLGTVLLQCKEFLNEMEETLKRKQCFSPQTNQKEFGYSNVEEILNCTSNLGVGHTPTTTEYITGDMDSQGESLSSCKYTGYNPNRAGHFIVDIMPGSHSHMSPGSSRHEHGKGSGTPHQEASVVRWFSKESVSAPLWSPTVSSSIERNMMPNACIGGNNSAGQTFSQQSEMQKVFQQHSSPTGCETIDIEGSTFHHIGEKSWKIAAFDSKHLDEFFPEQCLMDVDNHNVINEKIIKGLGADNTAKGSYKSVGGFVQLGAQGKILNDGSPGGASTFLLGFLKGSHFFCEMDFSRYLQQQKGRKIGGKLQRKPKGSLEFSRGRASHLRKVCLGGFFKNISFHDSCLRDRKLDETDMTYGRSFLPSLIFYSFLDMNQSSCSLGNVEGPCTVDQSTSKATMDVRETEIHTKEGEISSLLTSAQHIEIESSSVTMSFNSTAENNRITVGHLGREDETMVPESHWNAGVDFPRNVIVSSFLKNEMEAELQDVQHIEENGLSNLKGGRQFSFGVGVGVSFMISTCKNEIDMLGRLLKEAEDLVHNLRMELELKRTYQRQRSLRGRLKDTQLPQVARVCTGKYSVNMRQGKGVPTCKLGNNAKEIFREEHCDSQSVVTREDIQQVNQMDELEAELEAELERMKINNMNVRK